MNNKESTHLLSRWNHVAVPAAWLLATFGYVITFPIRISANSQAPEMVVGVASILIGATIAILNYVRQRAPNKQQATSAGRIISVGLFLACFLICWTTYHWLIESWTCVYTSETRLVIGGQPSEDLLAYVGKNKERYSLGEVCHTVKEYAGNTTRMYNFEDLALRYYLLVALYFCSWLSLTGLILSLVETIAKRR